MNLQFCYRKLQEARARAQCPDEGERAIGRALVDYWQVMMRSYAASGPVMVRSVDDRQIADLDYADES